MALSQSGERTVVAALASQSLYAAAAPFPHSAAADPAVAPSPHSAFVFPPAAALPSDAAPALHPSIAAAVPATVASVPHLPEEPQVPRRDAPAQRQSPRNPQRRPVLPMPSAAPSPQAASPRSRSASAVRPASPGMQWHLQRQQMEATERRQEEEERRKQEEQEWQQRDWLSEQQQHMRGRGRSAGSVAKGAGTPGSSTGYQTVLAARRSSPAAASMQQFRVRSVGSSVGASRGVSSAMVAPDVKKMASAFTAAAAAHSAGPQGPRRSVAPAEAAAVAARSRTSDVEDMHTNVLQERPIGQQRVSLPVPTSTAELLGRAEQRPFASAAQQEQQPSLSLRQRHLSTSEQQKLLAGQQQYPTLLQQHALPEQRQQAATEQQRQHPEPSTNDVRKASVVSLPAFAGGDCTLTPPETEVVATRGRRWTTASGSSVAAEDQQPLRFSGSSTAPHLGRDSIARGAAAEPHAPAAGAPATSGVQNSRPSLLVPLNDVASGSRCPPATAASAVRRASEPMRTPAFSPSDGVPSTAAESIRCPYCHRSILLPRLYGLVQKQAGGFAVYPAARRRSSSSVAAVPPTHPKGWFKDGAGRILPTQSQWGCEPAFVPYSLEQQEAAAATAAAITATLAEAERRGQVKAWGPLPLSFFCSPYNTQRWLRPP